MRLDSFLYFSFFIVSMGLGLVDVTVIFVTILEIICVG